MSNGPFDPREWLASQDPPLAIAGARGRFSHAAKEALAAAEAAGVRFLQKGTQVTTVTRVRGGETITEVREVDPYAPHAEPIRTGVLTFENGSDTLKVNASEVCINADCMKSFGWCYCEVPRFRHWRTGVVYTFG